MQLQAERLETFLVGTYKSSYYQRHKEQHKSYMQAWYIKHKVQYKARCRRYKLRIRYGITVDEYDLMFSKQEGRCAICRRHQKEFAKPLAVDHNHLTGKIRKLLCYRCNNCLGMVNDSVSMLYDMADYLDAQRS
jgi:hypothetical protein